MPLLFSFGKEVFTMRLLRLGPVAALLVLLCLAGCQAAEQAVSSPPESMASAAAETPAPTPAPTPSTSNQEESVRESALQTGIIPEQVLEGETGEIHYSYYLPEGYGPSGNYPLVMAMPGYDMMWFGEDSSGSNLDWPGFLHWTQRPEDMIVVSAQLTDWGETSARQAVELTTAIVDGDGRVVALASTPRNIRPQETALYDEETMSRAVAMRPDLYAAYLHGASQWDGDFTPVAENGVAVYIFMAENDEYYGSERAREAYNGLHQAYVDAGWSEEDIANVLQIQTPDNAWFAEQGISGNYHGGATVVYEQTDILEWVLSHSKEDA